MSDFADVEQFAHQHAACGGLTPSARSRPGSEGGYLLTITCACGATHDRWVTSEEASRPLSRPRRPPDPFPPPVTAPTPARAWPARPLPPAPQRIGLAVAPARRRSRGRGVWLVLLVVLVLGAAAAYVTGITDELPTVFGEHPAAPKSLAAAGPPPVPLESAETRQRTAFDEIVKALRQLQADTTPGASLNDYASRVAVTRLNVERLVLSAPEVVRAPAREALDVHRLAVGAWRARTIDDRAEWARVGQDPAIELCPSVKRAADAVAPAVGAPRARARGVVVGAVLQPLWECAAERVAALERSQAGR